MNDDSDIIKQVRTTDFARALLFKECIHQQKTYVYNIKIGTLYYCQKCKKYRKIIDIM